MVLPTRIIKFSEGLFFYGLILLAVSIPLSKFTMSISQFMIVGGWLLSGDFKGKWISLRNNKAALLLMGLYLIHLLGMLYSSDLQYGFKDLRIKLPVLLLPLMLATAPLISVEKFRYLLVSVVAGTVISTFISFFIYKGWIERQINDIRDISIFISHIRLVLMCCVSVFILTWFVFIDRKIKPVLSVISILLSFWLVYFIMLLQSATGLIILFIAFSLIAIYLLFKSRSILLKLTPVAIFVLMVIFSAGKIRKVQQLFEEKEYVTDSGTPLLTAQGNEYTTYPDRNDFENGYPIWEFLCEPELEQEWNKRSEFDYMGKDSRDQLIRFTLIRFLTSKGYTKDSVGVWRLTGDEVAAIERGVTNEVYLNGGSIEARLHQVWWEIDNYRRGKNPSGHSVAQRFEYWKSAAGIIKKNLWTGVGTGDVPDAFEAQYREMDSVLSAEWRLRAHNQYLSLAVAFGIPGLFYFLIMLGYPLLLSIQRFDYLYFTFAISAILSMLTEDTLETQAGVTYFMFFICLFLFVNPRNRYVDGNDRGLSNPRK